MKVPYNWMKEYVPDAPAPGAVGERLALVGTEVERIASVGVPGDDGNGGAATRRDSYRVGKVVSFEQHPNADRLRLCSVDVGDAEPRQIVCGASNFNEGDRVAVVLPGATLPDGSKLGKAKLRGVESHGMMLSERELELSTDHSGIMLLPPEWRVGDPLEEYLPLGDTVLELEVTSNRPDCLSVYGVARETSAAFDIDLVDAWSGDAEAAAGDVSDFVSVEVVDPELCPRYMARAFEGVTVGEAPAWLRARLVAAGMRPINNVVDITNYVMLLVGQPLHAFDAEQLRERRIVVRRAHPGERVTTLDDIDRELPNDALVIADAERTAVIAGIMGASDVEVTEATTTVVLEAACFSGQSIMKTSQQLGLRSESSGRFEKGLDAALPEVAMRLASKLLVDLCGARMASGTVDVCAPGALDPLPAIELTSTLLARTLGVEVPAAEVERILTRLGYEAATTGDGAWAVTVPHWRSRDTTRPIDLVEEVGRIYGLDKVPSLLPPRAAAIGSLSRSQRLQRLLEDTAAGLGLHEALTYALVAEGDAARWGTATPAAVRNPMTREHVELRSTALSGLVEVVRHNRSVGIDDVAVFEFSRSFVHDPEINETHVHEARELVFCCAGNLHGSFAGSPPLPADVSSALGIAQSLVAAASVSAHVVLPEGAGAQTAYLHPVRSGRITASARGVTLGWVGELHPALLRDLDLRGPVVAGVIDIEALLGATVDIAEYTPISDFPPVRQDVAFVLPTTVRAGDLIAVLEDEGGSLLEQIDVFDRYEGDPIPAGHYSLALRLVFRSADATLTDAEVADVRGRMTARAANECGAELRDG